MDLFARQRRGHTEVLLEFVLVELQQQLAIDGELGECLGILGVLDALEPARDIAHGPVAHILVHEIRVVIVGLARDGNVVAAQRLSIRCNALRKLVGLCFLFGKHSAQPLLLFVRLEPLCLTQLLLEQGQLLDLKLVLQTLNLLALLLKHLHLLEVALALFVDWQMRGLRLLVAVVDPDLAQHHQIGLELAVLLFGLLETPFFLFHHSAAHFLELAALGLDLLHFCIHLGLACCALVVLQHLALADAVQLRLGFRFAAQALVLLALQLCFFLFAGAAFFFLGLAQSALRCLESSGRGGLFLLALALGLELGLGLFAGNALLLEPLAFNAFALQPLLLQPFLLQPLGFLALEALLFDTGALQFLKTLLFALLGLNALFFLALSFLALVFDALGLEPLGLEPRALFFFLAERLESLLLELGAECLGFLSETLELFSLLCLLSQFFLCIALYLELCLTRRMQLACFFLERCLFPPQSVDFPLWL
eukprot:comp22037_c0_seq2/m.50818 comp22037_c0_seq2/g.50818  ORF comp22037_c0_seq2/g.50818 comp22037_c0_seq2/m.50818 type:complete len:481 (+) comp22037_c0_seq2:813-2255(+)